MPIADHGVPHSPRRALLVNAAELLREPGLRRVVDATIETESIELDDDRLRGPVHAVVQLVSTLDGLLAEATSTVRMVSECSRCLAPIDEPLVVEAEERYSDGDGDTAGDVVPIKHGQVDLAPFVRETVLLALALAPRCRENCAGLCPACGIDRNIASCDCVSAVADDRWAALDVLRLDADAGRVQ